MSAVRWSTLKYMADCPAVYKHVLDNGVVATPAMKFGSLVHGMVLGFPYSTPVVYGGERRGNVWKDFQAANEGAEIVTQAEWDRASDCALAVKDDPICGPLVASGIKEHRLTWEIAGRACAGTPDVNGDILLDLKVTPMASPFRIAHHARKMMWQAQLSWYGNGVQANGGLIKDYYLLAVQPKPPYLPVPYRLTEETVEYGTRVWRSLFEQLRVCESSGSFPGYAQGVLPLDITADDLTLTIGGEEWEL